jgi:hypothetical protein
MIKRLSKPSSGNWRYVPALASAALALFMLGASGASWAALRAELDHTSVQDGDTVTLSIENDSGQSRERPDVTPLRKDFDVLGTSTSSETSIVNGSRSERTRWLVRLQPRHAGTIDIPPITMGSEHTAALELKVTAPSPQAANQASRHVFLEVEAAAAGKSIYVQQQIPYTIRLYYDDTIQTGELAAPDPADAIVEQLGEEKRYTAMHGGRQFNVIERRYAIAPEKSGALRIPPASFRGSFAVSENGQGDGDPAADLMDRLLRNTPFANNPAFMSGLRAGTAFGNPGQPVTARSPEIALNVQPRPAGAQGHWLPAEQVALHDSWEDHPPQFKVGEPVTRTITIDAKGLAASQIPPLSLEQPANARLYADAPDNQSRTDGNAIYGISKQSVTYIPNAQGTLDIPPVELAWWNTRSNAPGRVALPAREFNVEAGAAGQSNASPAAPAGAVRQAISAAAPSTGDHPRENASLTERLLNHRAWLAAGAALLALAILTVLGLRRFRRAAVKSGPAAMLPVTVPRHKAAMRALQQACAANDSRAAADALLDVARAKWPKDPPRGLVALAARLEAGAGEVSALDRSLYGTGGLSWEGHALWEIIRRGLQAKRSETLREDDGLVALYL